MNPYVHYSVIYNYQDLEEAQVSISRWMDKITMAHLHNAVILGHKKEGNITLCESMDKFGVHYAKWNKLVREKRVPYDLTDLRNLTNKQETDAQIENRLTAIRAEGASGGWNCAEIKQKTPHRHKQQYGVTRGAEGSEEATEGKRGINRERRRFDLGTEHTIQHTNDVSYKYKPEIYIVFLNNVTPINSPKILR